jgi:hypothetical protein
VSGVDENFYSGLDYCPIPSDLIDALLEWCRSNASNCALTSRGATRDEPQEVFFIPLEDKKGRDHLKKLVHTLAPKILSTLQSKVVNLTFKNFCTSAANGDLDEARGLIDFRDALIRFVEKPIKRAGKDAALIIGGV